MTHRAEYVRYGIERTDLLQAAGWAKDFIFEFSVRLELFQHFFFAFVERLELFLHFFFQLGARLELFLEPPGLSGQANLQLL
jgi:hypothetical protein